MPNSGILRHLRPDGKSGLPGYQRTPILRRPNMYTLHLKERHVSFSVVAQKLKLEFHQRQFETSVANSVGFGVAVVLLRRRSGVPANQFCATANRIADFNGSQIGFALAFRRV